MAMTGRILTVAVAVISFVFLASVDAQEFRVFDPMGKEDTSRCIGDPRTPLCAVETHAACIYRGDSSLCDKVGYDYKAVFGDLRPGGYGLLYYYRFREIERKALRAADIPPRYGGDGPKKWRPGDVAIHTYWEGCPPNDRCVMETINDPSRPYGEGCRGFDRCGVYPFKLIDIVRFVGGKWVYVASYGEDEKLPIFGKRK